jgi:hypothetical protein
MERPAKGLGRVKTLRLGLATARSNRRPAAHLIAAISGLIPTMFITRVRL